MKNKLLLSLIAVGVFFFSQQILAETLTVGNPDAPHYFQTIQEAIDGSSPNDYIDIMPGTYEGDINLDGKAGRTITGSISDPTAVKIKGKVKVTNFSDVTLQYLVINNEDQPEGLKINGASHVSLDYVTVENSLYGIVVKDESTINVNNSEIKNCLVTGMWLFGSYTEIEIHLSTFSGNGIGIRNEKTKYFFASESVFNKNNIAMEVVNDKKDVKVWDNSFTKNSIVFSKHNGKLSKTNNIFDKNITKVFNW